MQKYHANVDIYDRWVDADAAKEEYGLSLVSQPAEGKYDAVVVAVAHDCFREAGLEVIKKYVKGINVLFDVKYIFPISANLARL